MTGNISSFPNATLQIRRPSSSDSQQEATVPITDVVRSSEQPASIFRAALAGIADTAYSAATTMSNIASRAFTCARSPVCQSCQKTATRLELDEESAWGTVIVVDDLKNFVDYNSMADIANPEDINNYYDYSDFMEGGSAIGKYHKMDNIAHITEVDVRQDNSMEDN